MSPCHRADRSNSSRIEVVVHQVVPKNAGETTRQSLWRASAHALRYALGRCEKLPAPTEKTRHQETPMKDMTEDEQQWVRLLAEFVPRLDGEDA